MDATATPKYEMVPTPSQFVGDVYALLAKLMGTSQPIADGTEDDASTPDPLNPTVTTDEALIRRMYDESKPSHRALFKRLAMTPGTWIYSSELAADLGLEGGSKSLAGTLGALGRRSNHRYGGTRAFHSGWDPGKGEAKHMMDADAAAVINAL